MGTEAELQTEEQDRNERVSRHDALAPIRSSVMRSAAEAVLRRHRETGVDLERVAELLAAVGLAVAERADGKRIPVDERLRSVPAAKLLHELRADVVRMAVDGEGIPPTELLPVLEAFEDVFRIMGGSVHAAAAAWDREFADRLSGAGGLELVVEVAHDLRSPLTSILFLAETLQRGQSGNVNDLQHRQLGLIYSAALGLSTLSSNVMELARGGNRLADDEPVPFSVRDVLESVADIVRPMAEEKGLAIRLLPPTSDHRLGPAQALSRVMLNLTTNAIKFTEEGFVELVAKSTDRTRLEFSVRDTGHGISEQALHTLYQPFRRRREGAGLTFSGTGLGLALCRKLVEVMGADLAYETRPDWGTRFYFELDLPPAERP